ncbi:MAG: hypothetical protein ACI8V4_003512 [Ilumatobacter sp.]|jgi:hypothetical protein
MSFAPPNPLEGTPHGHAALDDALASDPKVTSAAAAESRPARRAQPGPPVRPGDLTFPWRAMLAMSWIMTFFAYAAVWQASVQIGIGTWWLGPRGNPAPAALKLMPFGLSLAMALLVIYNVRRLVRVSLVGVALAALISIPDFSRTTGLGVAEVTIAGFLGLVTVSALSGQYRQVRADPTDLAPPPV